MNKRKKATYEVKRIKILNHLSSIVETEKIDELQKKALISDIEIYKQKNNYLYDQNQELKQENKIFFGILMFLLKDDDEKFLNEIYQNEQDAFLKRILDCIMKFKSIKQKKNKKNNEIIEDAEFINQNSNVMQKIILEIDNSILSKTREIVEEKDDILYALQKKIIDLEFQLKEKNECYPPTIERNSDTQIQNVDINKIHEIIKSREQSQVAELNIELEKMKSIAEEKEKLISEKNTFQAKLEDAEKIIKTLESQIENLVKENTSFSRNIHKKIKEIEDKKISQLKDYVTQINGYKEMNSLLKDEINELETKLEMVDKSDSKKDSDFLELKKEVLSLRNARDVVELERKEVYAERERLKSEKNKNEEMENKFNAEIISLKSELQNRINAAAFHKKNFIKIDNEIKYINLKYKDFQKEEIPLKNELKEVQKKLLLLKNENKLLYDDISNYKAVFQEILGTSSPELIESIEKYRKLLRCPTCDRNYKDTVIDKCMHVLCRECVDNRLKTRSRKCPVCAESFCATDVKRIFL